MDLSILAVPPLIALLVVAIVTVAQARRREFKSYFRVRAGKGDMWWRVYLSAALLTLLGCSQASGTQVTIENPKNLPVREEQVTLLYTMICQEVAKTYHIRDYRRLERPLTLVLGEDRERYSIDSGGTGTIYLRKWDEQSFAACAAKLAVHNVLSSEQFTVVVLKTLGRYRNTRPISVSEARTYANDNAQEGKTNHAKNAGEATGDRPNN